MKQHRSLIFILAALAMLGPFSIDTYLPSFPAIAQEFAVDPVLVQQTLSVYLLCFAGMMLFHGTLSDSFGRRPIILTGLAVFALASIGAAFAPSLGWLIVFRALQGLASGAGTVVGRAMIRDLFAGADAQKMFASVTMVFVAAPAVAPVLGGWLQVWFGWRSIFYLLSGMSLLLWIVCWFALPESLVAAKRHPFNTGHILRRYWVALKHPRYLLLIFSLGLCSVGFFIYVASAPHFVIDVLHLPETAFGWLFIPIVSGILVGAGAASRLAHRWTPRKLITVGYGLMLIAAASNIGYNLLFTAHVPWAVMPLFMYAAGMALASPSTTVLAMDVFPIALGLAASLQSFIQLLLFALAAAVVAPVVGASAIKLAIALATVYAGSLMCMLVLGRMARAPEIT